MDSLIGITSDKWWKLLAENHYSIDSQYLGRAAVLTLRSLLNSYYKRGEDRKFGHEVDSIKVVEPLFIVGHWRSGTTLMHYILAQDDQFGYPSLYQVSNPHSFLSRPPKVSEGQSTFKRPMDDINLTLKSPGEDEFALSMMCLLSPILAWSFPRNEAYYDRFLTFRDVSPEQKASWEETVLTFYRKITAMYRKPLLLKSPPHTARIGMLQKLFPDARFIHIYRNPIEVFQSTIKLYDTAVPYSYLQKPDSNSLIDSILARYVAMYDAFYEDAKYLDEKRFIEISFEELNENMFEVVKRIYRRLDIQGFSNAQNKLERYIKSIANYHIDAYKPLPEQLHERVVKTWERSFELWGYSV